MGLYCQILPGSLSESCVFRSLQRCCSLEIYLKQMEIFQGKDSLNHRRQFISSVAAYTKVHFGSGYLSLFLACKVFSFPVL